MPIPPPEPQPNQGFKKGDFVFDPYGFGQDVIFQVVGSAGPLTFVVGDLFEEPTPVLTEDLQSLQDTLSSIPGAPAMPEQQDDGGRTFSALRSYVIRTANDEGILRLQMLKEGIDRLAPAMGVGLGVGLLLTYKVLKGMVEKMLKERVNAHEQSRDYGHPDQMDSNVSYFTY
jgi:hypothetical protein